MAPTVPPGDHRPGTPGGSGRPRRRAGFPHASRKEASAAGLPPAAGRSWRWKGGKLRAEKGCEEWGTRVTPQCRAGASAAPGEALAPGRAPSLPPAAPRLPPALPRAPSSRAGPGRSCCLRGTGWPSPFYPAPSRPTGERQRVIVRRSAELRGKDTGEGRVHPHSPRHVTQPSCWLPGHQPRVPAHRSQTRQRKPIISSCRWDKEVPTRCLGSLGSAATNRVLVISPSTLSIAS